MIRFPNLFVRGVSVGAFLAVCISAPPAHAFYGFPEEAQKKFPALDCTLNCVFCHGTSMGGSNNFRFTTNGRPGLGPVLQANGIDVTDLSSVSRAFDAAAAAGSDIDGDGMTDVAELNIGRDPYDPNPEALYCGGSAAGPEPEYGCGGGRIAPRGSVDGIAALAAAAALAIGGALMRRRLTLPPARPAK